MSYLLVVLGRVVLGEIVTKVSTAWGPIEVVLALFDSILKPVESHVNGFGAALLDSVSENAMGNRVVSLEGCGWLGMA